VLTCFDFLAGIPPCRLRALQREQRAREAMIVMEEVKILGERVKVRVPENPMTPALQCSRAFTSFSARCTNMARICVVCVVTALPRTPARTRQECYREEGVNHYRNCQELTRAYVQRVTSPTLKAGPVELKDVEE
jgi:hypothetical protein